MLKNGLQARPQARKNRRRTAIPPARHEPAKTGSFLFHQPVPEPARTGSFPLGTLRILMSRERKLEKGASWRA